MADRQSRAERPVRRVPGLAASAAAVVVVTLAIALLHTVVPVLSLGVLYLFAVLPVAAAYGLWYAIAVSVASMVAFNFFFLPPVHTLTLSDSGNWLALAVYLSTSVVVSELATRERRRARQAEQREREAAELAEVAATLVGRLDVASALEEVAGVVGSALGATRARMVLDGATAAPGEVAVPVGDDVVATLLLPSDADSATATEGTFLPAVGSLIRLALDRERLSREAADADALRRSDAAKTAVLRAVSHDLRSPITAIRVAADSLAVATIELTPADRRELVETVRVESRRLERIVSNLLDLSRLEAGAAIPATELWPPEALVEQALGELEERGATIAVDLAGDLPVVRADAAQVRRALVNLLENALAASSAADGVRVSARDTATHVELLVTDRGAGVPADDVDRIFEPFQRGRGAAPDGAGLGLAIVRGFAAANGGYVRFEQPRAGGARFVLGLQHAEAGLE